MVLLSGDIERLEKSGYRREDFSVESGGLARLRNAGGYCCFYDKTTGLCRACGRRPLGCRLYPLVFDEARGVPLDPECPLSALFARGRSQLRAALPVLLSALEALSKGYGISYDARLLKRSSKNC